MADLPALIAAGHKAGALVVVDSTFATPLLQRPLHIGADITMHSVTKYIGGHSDLLMGALVLNDQQRVKVCLPPFPQDCIGAPHTIIVFAVQCCQYAIKVDMQIRRYPTLGPCRMPSEKCTCERALP